MDSGTANRTWTSRLSAGPHMSTFVKTSPSNHSGTNQSGSYSKEFVYGMCAGYIAVMCVAVIGNAIVIVTIVRNTSLRRVTTNLFILSLAFSDLLTASLAMPFDLEALAGSLPWKHGHVICDIWATMYLIAVPTSILTLLAVAVERFKTLKDPLNKFRESHSVTHRRAIIAIFTLWGYSIMFAVVPLIGWRRSDVSVIDGQCIFNITHVYSALSSVVNFLLPVILTAYLYVRIFMIAHRHAPGAATQQNTDHKAMYRNIRAARTVAVIVFAFFLCWAPFTVLSVTMATCYTCTHAVSSELFSALLLLGYTNSALNPFLYSFKDKRFRVTCVRMLRSLRSRKQPSLSREERVEHAGKLAVNGPKVSDVLPNNQQIRLTNFNVRL
ncbi:tyramine receptor Ser-2 isoform X3 [Nematostella vectensis]|uniref:tyramine receptor Ser-2 isoform X3 n=1 Tax=Nematostella vectensis TaxID=45351 RepID=UPI00139027D9|nr:tyramine receptor Ser-2 isoform X3 [Nematostella vectensis]